METPETRYATTSDGVHIAYQVAGIGPPDIVYLSSWDLAIDFLWDEPTQISFFGRLAAFSRLVRFDKRGTGASDSVSLSAMPTLESWIDDVTTVMDEAESERAFVFATTWSGPLAILFAALRPDRTAGLVLHNTFARRRWAPDYACGRSDEEIHEGIAQEEAAFGTADLWSAVAVMPMTTGSVVGGTVAPV